MRIKDIKNRNRRDFTAVYECEHCGHTKESHGYDDEHFHQNVVPKMECESCGKTAVDASDVRTPRYPEGKVV